LCILSQEALFTCYETFVFFCSSEGFIKIVVLSQLFNV